ncbi:hypothetical protein [Streptomyces cavernicola]|uniref:Uncharacterized protein n=1 Tax=Streptomyces cavernicola TaxID=3043613 RepID=A0ABT6SIM7_9ACTN|nr:hypothetical protein [Streptomyces sp. B-S-A6]MDI3408048.1 hypothetical protein [Streptomyces sp. B-S-A6]
MSAQRAEDQVRRLLDGPHPVVPPELCPEAVRRGARRARRRARGRWVLWLLLGAAFVGFMVWATLNHPWTQPPANRTPPLEGW